ncbi:YodC family protein [Thiobacillus denitrificans]|uniref:YodC family protein n=1 Tax=Thiobacillus denitrificans TaxID=36861 RepID=UPI00059C9BAE|nr:DUF2158 domain-containing protein [Thiobacillus denitrificans]
MESELKVGDVVKLRSGGTRMTVEHIDGDQVACTWFEGKTLERATFIAGALMKHVPTSVGVIRARHNW